MIRIDTAIIGGGVVGAAILREIALSDTNSVFLFERAHRLGEGQTGRSSGVVHSGILYPPESLKARLCVESNELVFGYCARRGVPVARTGKLIVATTDHELGELERLSDHALHSSVRGVEMLSAAQVSAREPNVRALAALSVPSAGIVDAASLTFALSEEAETAGAHIFTGFEIASISARDDGFEIRGVHRGAEQRFVTGCVVNAAGLRAFAIRRTLNPGAKGRPRALRGEYYKFNRMRRPEIRVSETLVYPMHQIVKSHDGRQPLSCIASVHLTPTFGYDAQRTDAIGPIVRIGPIFYPTDDEDDISPPRLPAELFAQQCARYLPGIDAADLEPDAAGVMAAFDAAGSSQRDFLIERDPEYAKAIHLLGIGSPGLTCSLAIARHVKGLLGAH